MSAEAFGLQRPAQGGWVKDAAGTGSRGLNAGRLSPGVETAVARRRRAYRPARRLWLPAMAPASKSISSANHKYWNTVPSLGQTPVPGCTVNYILQGQAVCRGFPHHGRQAHGLRSPVGGRSATEPDDRAGSCAEKVDGVVPARPFFVFGSDSGRSSCACRVLTLH